MKNPPHPGETVLYDCLEPLGLSVTQGAKVLGCHAASVEQSRQPQKRHFAGDGDTVGKSLQPRQYLAWTSDGLRLGASNEERMRDQGETGRTGGVNVMRNSTPTPVSPHCHGPT
jgi:hypothetical protein